MKKILASIVVIVLAILGVNIEDITTEFNSNINTNSSAYEMVYDGDMIEYVDDGFTTLEDFDEFDYEIGYEYYEELDELGRTGTSMALVSQETMPTKKRESISHVYPSGWEQDKYDTDLVDGGWIYNRSHQIGHQLTGEDDNERNLMTGTRSFNVDGMLPYENIVAEYVKDEDGQVLYVVEPIYKDEELVARGVEMMAYSLDDDGESVNFHVFIHNVQEGIEIDYLTGETSLEN